MKNPNGFGTAYKMKGKRKNKWRAVKTIGWDENGKQKRITIGYFFEKKDALDALGKYIYNPNAKLTLGEVYEMWSEQHFKKVSFNRARDITYRYKSYISVLENEYIVDVNLSKIQNFIDNLKVSSGTINNVKAILNMMFEYSVKNEYIEKNPVKFVELGKYKKVQIKKEITSQELQILWDNLKLPYVDIVIILIYTGMRVSELLNLKKENINLENKVIFISESKTDAGIRNIPIHEKILPLIINRIKATEKYLVNLEGRKISYTFFRKNFNFVFTNLGLYPHTPHECRHTTATLLSNAGANTISIAKIMGHTNYNMTASVYTHKDEIELKKAMNTLN